MKKLLLGLIMCALALCAVPGVAENAGYEMLLYTEGDDISVWYPRFSGDDTEALNALVYDKASGFSRDVYGIYEEEVKLTLDYQAAVTLQSDSMVSVVFWGYSHVEGSAHPTSDLYTLNVDLFEMKEITLWDMYDIDDEFERVFFEKAYFPTPPVTSYDAESFAEALTYQTPEYQMTGPFDTDDAQCFFKPDGIVISLSAIHATGSDHFEAQLNYDDIRRFRKPQTDYFRKSPEL